MESPAAPEGHRAARPGDYTPDSLAYEVNKTGEEGGGGGGMGGRGGNTTCGRRGEQTEGMEALLGGYGVRGVCPCVCEVGWVGGRLLFLTETNWSY